MGRDDETSLVERVEAGALPRQALEVLSLLGDAPARRALGRLPLELAEEPPIRWPEEDPPLAAQRWRALAAYLSVLDPIPAVLGSVALVRELRELAGPEEPAGSTHVGLHTGPAGILRVTDAVAAEVFPVRAVIDRVLAATDAWIASPDEARAAAVGAAWPALLTNRRKVEFCAELGELDWRGVWACRWLVGAVSGPAAQAGPALGCVATYAEGPLGGRLAVVARLRGAMREALLAG